jgi:hypothetical protein
MCILLVVIYWGGNEGGSIWWIWIECNILFLCEERGLFGVGVRGGEHVRQGVK